MPVTTCKRLKINYTPTAALRNDIVEYIAERPSPRHARFAAVSLTAPSTVFSVLMSLKRNRFGTFSGKSFITTAYHDAIICYRIFIYTR